MLYLSMHEFVLVYRTFYVSLPSSPFHFVCFPCMEVWSGGGPGRGTRLVGSDKVPTRVIALYLYFYIHRNIYFSSKFHVQLFIFIDGCYALNMLKWNMLDWILTLNIFYAWIYICCWGKIVQTIFWLWAQGGLLRTSGWGTNSFP